MESKNLMIAGVWAFAIIWLAGSFLAKADLLFSIVIFFIAIGVSSITVVLPKESTHVGP